MTVSTKIINNILLITLPRSYDFYVEEQIIKLANESDQFKDIKHIVIDCSSLKLLESFGGEFFTLKDKVTNPNRGEMVFVGLEKNKRFIFDEFSKKWFNAEVNNFDTIDEALIYLEKV